MKKFLISLLAIVGMLCAATLSRAVLNEDSLAKTLQVLLDELTRLGKEQQSTIAALKQFDEYQHQEMLRLVQESNETALVLYSQDEGYIFNITYACNEATRQYNLFVSKRRPFAQIVRMMNDKIDRYNRLINALEDLPPHSAHNFTTSQSSALGVDNAAGAIAADDSTKLSLQADSIIQNIALEVSNHIDSLEAISSRFSSRLSGRFGKKIDRETFFLNDEQQAIRDSCLALAISIRDNITSIRDGIISDNEQYEAIEEKLKILNDYASQKYDALKADIFTNGDVSFLSMMKQPFYYIFTAIHDTKVKYTLTGEEKFKSSWRGPVVLFFAFFAFFYLGVAVLITNVIIRFLVPKRLKNEHFALTKNYYITGVSMLLFSLVMLCFKLFFVSNFFAMAAGLLVEFTLLMTVIVFSLLFRYDAHHIGKGLRIYLPVMALGFIVILCRIIFVPNSLVRLLFPILLLVFGIWQFHMTTRHFSFIPRTDILYAWISFATISVSCVCSWLGYTLLAVQLFTWWMMQLTCILGLTCAFDYMSRYEENKLKKKFAREFGAENVDMQAKAFAAYKNKTGEHIRMTWLADMVNMTILPVLATISFPLCIYWASGIFDLTDTMMQIYHSNLLMDSTISEEIYDGLILVPSDIVLVVALLFVFKYVNYILKTSYRQYIQGNGSVNTQANISLANNIISIVVWGTFGIMALVFLNVPSSGISIVTAGLATGIGFALKDVLNNFIYGMSLMTGRVRVGEIIECDGVRGKVESITYQSTQIQTLDGSIIAFLNSNLFAKSFKNLTRNHDYELVKIPVGVAYGSKIDEVRAAIVQRINGLIAKDSRGLYNMDPSKGVSVFFSDFGDSSLNLVVVIWVRIEAKLRVTSDVNEAIYNVLNDKGVSIPFPQVDVHMMQQ